MSTVVAAMANYGRARSVRLVRTAFKITAKTLLAEPDPVTFGALEIDEGDKTTPSDHDLIEQYLGPDVMRRQWSKGSEPILSRGLRLKRTLGNRTSVGHSVKRWLPNRHIQTTVYAMADGHELAHMSGHYPVTPKQFPRWPRLTRARMVLAYNAQRRLERRIQARHLRAGRDVVKTFDRNTSGYRPLHSREVVLAHRGPDWITGIPAKGRRITHAKQTATPIGIERYHQLLTVRVTFTDRKTGGPR